MQKHRENLGVNKTSQFAKIDERKAKGEHNQSMLIPSALKNVTNLHAQRISKQEHPNELQVPRCSALSRVSFGSILINKPETNDEKKEAERELEYVTDELTNLKREIQNFKLVYQQRMNKNNQKLKQMATMINSMLATRKNKTYSQSNQTTNKTSVGMKPQST